MTGELPMTSHDERLRKRERRTQAVPPPSPPPPPLPHEPAPAVQPGGAAPARSATPASRPGGNASWRFDLHRDFLKNWSMKLTKREANVWQALWSRSPRDGREFHVSGATLGADCGITRENASRATRALERHGLVVVVRRGRLGEGQANVFRLPRILPPPPSANPDGP